MKILIIGPRFHPNQKLIVKTLIDNGHNVFFRSLYKGKFEDYRYIKPKILKGLLFFNRIYFPNPVDVYKTFLQIKPKIIILRQYSRILTYLVTLLSVRFKTKIFIYEQAPSDLSHLKKKK
jgi:hypothetical protein